MTKLLLSIPETAGALGIGMTKAQEEINAGRLLVVKIGRKSLIPQSNIDAYIQARIDEAMAEVEEAKQGRGPRVKMSERFVQLAKSKKTAEAAP